MAEYGVIFTQSIKALRCHLLIAIEDAENELFHVMQDFLPTLYRDFVSIRKEITTSFVMIPVLFIVLAVTLLLVHCLICLKRHANSLLSHHFLFITELIPVLMDIVLHN